MAMLGILDGDHTAPFRLSAEGGTLRCEGEIDVFGADALEQALGLHEECDVVDLRGAGFLDHHAILALARHAESLRERGGTLTILGAGYGVRRLWKLVAELDEHAVRWG